MTRRRFDPGAATLAFAAALWHIALMTRAANDNFMHMAMAQQWLAGDWPVRDFFDNGSLLQFALSALAQWSVGNRLLGEALIVGVAWAISTYLVFVLVRRLTGSLPLAVVASLLLIVAGARGYSYPKGVVYAVAASVWWAYVRRPGVASAAGFGAWVAVAYYWRPDHGVYVAFGLVLAALAAHGLRREAVTRTALAGATTLALVAPFWAYVHSTVGLPDYARTALAAVRSEHGEHGPHEWPIVRFGGRMLVSEPPERYAPVVNVRWSAGTAPEARDAIRTRYGLTSLEVDGETERVRLSARSVSEVAALIREPIIEDTAGIDRFSATLLSSAWPAVSRWRFEHAWLRLRLLPDLDGHMRAAEYAVAIFLFMPVVLLIASPWMAPHLGQEITPWQLSAFAAFTFAVAIGMLRQPFTARAADAVVLCSVSIALCTAWLWRAGTAGQRVRALQVLASRAAAVVLAVATTTNVAAAGQFGQTLDTLAGNPMALKAAAGAWAGVGRELTASPPLAHYLDRPARFPLQLAAYARGCLPPTDRVLVLWFEPEIPYFSERLMAQRHLVFPPGWATLAHEQHATLEKITRYKPPLAFAVRSALDRTARAVYPRVVEYVEREYELAATAENSGEEYLIFARKDRPRLAEFGSQRWPCFVGDPSPWFRVGVPIPALQVRSRRRGLDHAERLECAPLEPACGVAGPHSARFLDTPRDDGTHPDDAVVSNGDLVGDAAVGPDEAALADARQTVDDGASCNETVVADHAAMSNRRAGPYRDVVPELRVMLDHAGLEHEAVFADRHVRPDQRPGTDVRLAAKPHVLHQAEETAPHTVQRVVRDRDVGAEFVRRVAVDECLERDDRKTVQLAGREVLPLDGEGDDSVGRVVREVLVRDLGRFAGADDDQLPPR